MIVVFVYLASTKIFDWHNTIKKDNINNNENNNNENNINDVTHLLHERAWRRSLIEVKRRMQLIMRKVLNPCFAVTSSFRRTFIE